MYMCMEHVYYCLNLLLNSLLIKGHVHKAIGKYNVIGAYSCTLLPHYHVATRYVRKQHSNLSSSLVSGLVRTRNRLLWTHVRDGVRYNHCKRENDTKLTWVTLVSQYVLHCKIGLWYNFEICFMFLLSTSVQAETGPRLTGSNVFVHAVPSRGGVLVNTPVICVCSLLGNHFQITCLCNSVAMHCRMPVAGRKMILHSHPDSLRHLMYCGIYHIPEVSCKTVLDKSGSYKPD